MSDTHDVCEFFAKSENYVRPSEEMRQRLACRCPNGFGDVQGVAPHNHSQVSQIKAYTDIKVLSDGTAVELPRYTTVYGEEHIVPLVDWHRYAREMSLRDAKLGLITRDHSERTAAAVSPL